MKRTLFQRIQIWFIGRLAKVSWNSRSSVPLLSNEEKALIREKCANDYYIIATRKSNYLTTFFITLGNFLLTGKWGFYSHVLMNLEDTVEQDSDFRFIEATGKGTHLSTFEEVFNHVDAVALIKPKSMTITEWTKALDKAKTYLGRPYDNLFDLKSDLEINCAELVQLALKDTTDYEVNFAEFNKLVSKKKKITPDMFANCEGFEVVLTVSH